MEKLGVEVNIKIWYLVFKKRKIYIFQLDFYTISKSKKNMKPYMESSFHVDLKNCKTIEYLCRNNGEHWCWSECKNLMLGEVNLYTHKNQQKKENKWHPGFFLASSPGSSSNREMKKQKNEKTEKLQTLKVGKGKMKKQERGR